MKPLLAVVFIIMGVFAYLWQQTTATRLGYKVSDLQAKYDRINAENDLMRLKINSVLSLEKMDRIAKEKNLYKPAESSVVHIE